MNNENYNERAYSNKQACIMYTVIVSILCLAYIVQLINGKRTPLIFTIQTILCVGPLILSWLIRSKDPASAIIKHVMGSGYALFYIFTIFTTYDTRGVYVYAIPMILIVMLFDDFKFSVIISAGVALLSVIHAVFFTAHQNWASESIAEMEIEIAVMVVTCLFTILVNKVIVTLNAQKVEHINEAGEKTNNLLSNVMDISGKIADQVDEVSDKMKLLVSSSENTLTAMEEIQSGTGDSANSVQNQLFKTEEIQSQIDRVTEAAGSISENVSLSDQACSEGRSTIDKLMEQVKKSETAGTKAVEEVTVLENSTSEMQSIVSLIESIASQTSLLALNASIEAARAGEAGRGFSVVATEISNLAGQTQSATSDISELINGIVEEMNQVIAAIDLLVESNKLQNESASITKESFEKIVESIDNIRTTSNDLSGIVVSLKDANTEIVESIQTISAITEEVSAHSNTTMETTQQNSEIVNEVQDIVTAMSKNAAELNSLK